MTDDRHSEHDEHRDLDGCTICRAAFEEAYAEHAWMGKAVKTWTGGNPYAPTWTEDADGYIVAPLENRGTLDAG